MKDRMDRCIYGGRPFEVTDAAGVEGVLIRSGDRLLLRVYDENKEFIDYDIMHDDLSVTISKDALACFYSNGEHHAIDHSPTVLGLKEAST
jgi:hypothetical protein